MTLYPNCKINIGLAVVRKREDGYHDLDTLFYPVYGLHDTLEVEPAEEFRLEQEGITVDCAAEENLVAKAYRLMERLYPEKVRPVHVKLSKHIPFGAGLGGGSADATFMAKALNEIYGLGLSREELAKTVSVLGADCAFFAYNTPCHATGIGDVLEPVEYHRWDGYRLVMVKPDVHVSTKEAYSGVTPREDYLPGTVPAVVGKSTHQGLSPIGSPRNDFEESVFAAHPELGEIKQALVDAGAEYAAMSGSGSTIYGFFPPSVFFTTLQGQSRRVGKSTLLGDSPLQVVQKWIIFDGIV